MTKVIYKIVVVLFSVISISGYTQSLATYTVTRSTGISYTSIASTGTPVSSWRYVGGFSQDDNRSNLTNIGFDFWYNGTRYTQFNVSTNGYIDFSSSTADGGPTTGAYGYDNTQFSGAGTTPGSGGTLLALAPMYDDMTTQGGGDPLGSSIKYEVSGSTPNRVLTVEWINMAVYGNTTPDLNFQVKLYETSGVIEFVYGTMTPGTAGWSYSCGINAATVSGTATLAQLNAQQTANTATFNNGETHTLATIPASDSKLTFTPSTPAAPSGSLTFTGVTNAGMTLNWTNWATNEVGYAIYRSEDDVTYTYITRTAANATTSAQTGLLPSTTYYWKVYAVTEGAVSAELSGNQATLNAGTITSTVSGNWNSGATWSSGTVPTSVDNVTIADGHTVTINSNASCFNLTVGQGTSGVLRIGNNTTIRTITVTGDITVSSGATFDVNTASNTTHVINLSGDIVNSGTVNMATDGNSLANITFSKNGSQSISGSGGTSNFNRITTNMGTSANNILDITSTNFSAASNFLTITNGTFKLSTVSSLTVTPFSGAAAVPTTGGFWINSSTATVNCLGTISLYGGIKVSSGTVNVGDAINENITSYGGSLEITGGALNIAGRLDRVNNVTITTFLMSGGTLTVPTIGSTTAALAPFQMDVVGSIFTMSGGTIVIQQSGATNLGFLASDGILNVTDGTLQIGNASTPVSQTIQINSAVSLANLVVNSSNATAQLASALTVFNDFTISSGAFNANNFAFTLGRHWSNSGTFTPGTGTVTFNGTGTQNLTKSGGETFYNLTLNKSAGSLVLNNNVGVTNILTQTAGIVSCGSNTLTVGTSTASVGTFNYTAGTIVGKFKRWINATGVAIVFPVGTASYNRKAQLTFTNLTNGSLTTEFVSTNPGASGLPISDGGFSIANQFTEGYWDLTAADGLASTNYALELTGTGFTSYTIKPSTRILYRTTSGNPWSMNGTHVAATSPIAKRSALSGLSAQFALGSAACSAFNVSSITGLTSVCTSTLGVAYSVTNTPGNIYTWSITGGTQASGGTTNSITVNWGGTGMIGYVQVVEQNDCGDNNTAVTSTVNINPIPTSTITGLASVASLQSGVSYSVTNVPGYTYNWTITGGTQASGGTSNAITVNWGTATPTASVSVNVTRLCGANEIVTLPVVVRATIVSTTSGNWTAGGTWVGGVAPVAGDYVEIAATHTVTMNANPGACTKLTINGIANWTAPNTTNVGTGGIVISSTGNIIGSVAGVLTSTGGLTLNSTLSSSSVGILLQTTAGQTISGNGSLAKLTVNATATNTGTLSVTGTLAGSSTLTNSTNSVLNIGATSFTLTGIDASASGNTVNYTASSAQTIRGITYHHLGVSGAAVKTLGGTATLNGSLAITSGTLDVSSSNYALNVAGNWDNSGAFTPRFGTVVFTGTLSQSITKTGGETFNNITFSGAGTKTLGSNITVNTDLTINSNSTLSAGSNTINLAGNWSNSGTFTSGTSTVVFNGSSAQTISGSATADFYNMTVSSGAAVSLSTAQRLLNVFTLSGTGTFNTNNQFTLLSSSSRTASIGTLGTPANFSGNITMQRYVSGAQGYRYVGSAISNATLGGLTPELRMDGFPGTTQPSYWCNVYSYSESVAGAFANGWTIPSNVTDAMVVGKGYAVYFYSTNIPVTLDLTGTPNKGNISLPVTYNSSSHADDGWNLVSNPYPSAIDWDAGSGWTRTNIQGNTVYYWNDASQNYATYPVGGPGVNGATNIIPSSQAFMVKTSGASPVLSMTESVKTGSNPATQFWKQNTVIPYVLQFKLTNNQNSYYDETLIRFKQGATDNNDSLFDALKIASGNPTTPYLSSETADLVQTCINTFSDSTKQRTIAMYVKAGVNGIYTLKRKALNLPDDNTCVMLEDLVTGVRKNLVQDSTYSFSLSTTPNPVKRFLIHFLPPPARQETTNLSCSNSANGAIALLPQYSGSWNVTIKDSANNIVYANSNFTAADTASGLYAGTYFIYTQNTDSVCGSFIDSTQITAPTLLSKSAMLVNASCAGVSNGKIELSVVGGTSPYTYLWSNQETTNKINNLSSGNYSVWITDAAGCVDTATYKIDADTNMVRANFQLQNDTLYLQNGQAQLHIANTSLNASTYSWSFGDGNVSLDSLPVYSYSTAGTFILDMIAQNTYGCADTASATVVVFNLSNTSLKLIDEAEFKIYVNASNTLMVETTDEIVTRIRLINELGQEVKMINYLKPLKNAQLRVSGLDDGVYIIQIETSENTIHKKIMLYDIR